MIKYDTLVNILDEIISNANFNLDLYLPERGKVDIENARSRALIQFFLKSNFGVLGFEERESLITDGSGDGGLDAYFFDDNKNKIYFIQSKFRNNAKNYGIKSIKNEELWKMDIERIVKGETHDVKGDIYNKKVLNFQKELAKRKSTKISYENVIVIIANVTESQKDNIITSHFPKKWNIQIFDYKEVYNKLLFPYVTNSFFNEDKLCIDMLLPHKDKNPTSYDVNTEHGKCKIHVLFIPTKEIAKVFYKYKNSILKHNPRSYLGMKKEGVNKGIENSILNKKTNDFVLLNNGITMISTDAVFDDEVGRKGIAQITITNPQVINGGQTCFTLSEIYERMLNNEVPEDSFKDKEVLLKIIVQNNEDIYNKITSDVSLSTNSQSPIDSADLKANHIFQINLQNYIFESYGLFYERKRGEFFTSLKNSFIKKGDIINRKDFIRMAYSSNFPNIKKNPKNMSADIIFSDPIFDTIADQNKYDKFILSYLVFKEVQKYTRNGRKKENDWFFEKYGYALRYGDIGVIITTAYMLNSTNFTKKHIKDEVQKTLDKWKDFETFSFSKEENVKYFNKSLKENNPASYYKSDNLIDDLIDYFT